LIEDYERVLQASKQAGREFERKALEGTSLSPDASRLSIVGSEAEMKRLAQQKLQDMQDREWVIRWKGRDVFNVRKKVTQVVGVIQQLSGLIGAAASLDPVHAGLAWAGVCVVLPVRQRHLRKCQQ
jgi:hypothetical protein